MNDVKFILYEDDLFELIDVSDRLPKHVNFPHGTDVIKPNGKRELSKDSQYIRIKNRHITKVYFHQTAGSYQKGINGLLNTGHFFVRDPEYTNKGKWTGAGRGWPGFGYTIYIPHHPDFDTKSQKLQIYQCWPWDMVSWHTKGCNNFGVGVAFQGMFKSRHIKNFQPFKGTTGQPSPEQMVISNRLWEHYLKPKLKLTDKDLSGHFESRYPKVTCPGDMLEEFVLEIQKKYTDGPGDEFVKLDTWERRQAALMLLGHKLGSYGPKGNGIDGKPGNRTRMAIEAEEDFVGLQVDGVWDESIEYEIKSQLKYLGYSQKDIEKMLP